MSTLQFHDIAYLAVNCADQMPKSLITQGFI